MTTITRIGKGHWAKRGKRIEQARNFAGLTQGQLAASLTDLLGYKVGRQIIYILEHGERDIRGDERTGISIVLDQSEDWLDGVEGSAFNAEPNRVMPGYRDSTHTARVNHSPLGLLTHPLPALAA